MPMENGQIVVSFLPKHIGKFSQTIGIEYCDGTYTHPLYVVGESHAMGVKENRPRGLEKIAADFEPAYNYVNVGEIVKTPNARANLHSLTKIMKSDLFG